LVLPDQSRSIIPADWTDAAPADPHAPATPGKHANLLGSLPDLLLTRSLVDALLHRQPTPEERHHAHADESTLSGEPTTTPQRGDMGAVGQLPTRSRPRQAGARLSKFSDSGQHVFISRFMD